MRQASLPVRSDDLTRSLRTILVRAMPPATSERKMGRYEETESVSVELPVVAVEDPTAELDDDVVGVQAALAPETEVEPPAGRSTLESEAALSVAIEDSLRALLAEMIN